MNGLPAYFNDPFDPARSLQLNNRFWPEDTFQHLDLLRQAEEDLNTLRLGALRRSLKKVKSLLPPNVQRSFLSRVVYSRVYSVSFAPFRFSIELSDEFVRANSYQGPDSQVETGARNIEELDYVVDLVHSIYRKHYGMDVLTSKFAVRYMNSQNVEVVRRMTEHGDLSDYHFDEGKDFTCILYLSPVGRDNGCFSFIDGSPAVPKSHVLRALHQVADFDLKLVTPEQRSFLPLEFRGSLGVGTYLDDSKRDRLRGAAVDLVGAAGQGIIFNGFDTVHRGGKPLSGERTALFISTKGHINKRLKKAAYDLLAYLWL